MQIRHRWNRLFAALLVIAAGTLLLLDNFHVVQLSLGEIISDYWPLILIYFGLTNLIQCLRGSLDRREFLSGELFFALLLLFLGGNFLAGNLGFLHISWSEIWNLWPLFLIYWGIQLLFFPHRQKKHSPDRKEGKAGHWYHRRQRGDQYESNLLGEINIGKVPFSLESKDYWIGIGSIELNLTQAIIPEGETVLHASGLIGSINIYLPSQLPARVSGMTQLGSVELLGIKEGGFVRQTSFQSPEFENAEQRLVLDLSMVCGEIRVVRV